ncbi:MAG: HIT domain-containing protein [Victivallaceae bacterium]|nr:HIT domain-containing protein [Victivallaceae bacterium]
MSDCIFCKIAAGETPPANIYEDPLPYAPPDLGPINFGHTLVIPKEHHESASTIPESTAGRMFRVGSRIGIALKRQDLYDAFNLHLADGTAAGQVVMHAHLHVIPRGVEDTFRWNWRQLKYADGEMEATARAIISKLKLD